MLTLTKKTQQGLVISFYFRITQYIKPFTCGDSNITTAVFAVFVYRLMKYIHSHYRSVFNCYIRFNRKLK